MKKSIEIIEELYNNLKKSIVITKKLLNMKIFIEIIEELYNNLIKFIDIIKYDYNNIS
jgi:hypothetical protein